MKRKSSGKYELYLLTCTVTGKVYVGLTTRGVAFRWKEHVFNSTHNPRCYISRAIAKYGPESFTVETLGEAESLKQLRLFEMVFVHILKANDQQWGYNVTAGGEGTVGRKMSEEQRMQLVVSRTGKKLTKPRKKQPPLSDARKERLRQLMIENPRKPWLGKTLSESHRKALSDSGKGRKQSPQHVANKRAALIGNPKCNTWQGKNHSAESIAKMKAIKTAWWAQRKLAQGQAA